MLDLKIVSPERIEFEGQVESVLVPGTMGQFEILTNHAPIISSLGVGEVTYAVAFNACHSAYLRSAPNGGVYYSLE